MSVCIHVTCADASSNCNFKCFRYQQLEKAFQLARDIDARDLFMVKSSLSKSLP